MQCVLEQAFWIFVVNVFLLFFFFFLNFSTVASLYQLSKFLRRNLMIFIIKGIWTIVFMFIIIATFLTFQSICPPAFFRCLSNSGTYMELRTTSFIESTGVACSDSVRWNLWDLKAFEGQGLGARLCCRKYLPPYFGYIILPHVDWPVQCLAQRKSLKKYTKRKDRNR